MRIERDRVREIVVAVSRLKWYTLPAAGRCENARMKNRGKHYIHARGRVDEVFWNLITCGELTGRLVFSSLDMVIGEIKIKN